MPLQSSAKHADLWLPQPNKPHFQDAGRSSWRQSWGILTSFFAAKKIHSNARNPGSPPAVPRLVRSGIWTLNWSVSSMPRLQATKWVSKIKRREHQVGSKENSWGHSKPRHGKRLSNQWEYSQQSTNSAMATAFGWQIGLMRWEYITNIWKKGLLLNSYVSIFFFRLGQSFPVSSTDSFTWIPRKAYHTRHGSYYPLIYPKQTTQGFMVFFSHMTLGVHRYVAPSGHATSPRLAVERQATGHCRCPVVPGRKWQQATIENWGFP